MYNLLFSVKCDSACQPWNSCAHVDISCLGGLPKIHRALMQSRCLPIYKMAWWLGRRWKNGYFTGIIRNTTNNKFNYRHLYLLWYIIHRLFTCTLHTKRVPPMALNEMQCYWNVVPYHKMQSLINGKTPESYWSSIDYFQE